MMKNQLREAVDKVRSFYIQQLIDAGVYTDKDEEIHTLTLTELKLIFNKLNRQKEHG
ncbi:TRAP-type uncharacterized transport system substrate-binding protein [Salirhabdus euzebyi]|uniref:TRAP-type uncharacterized transport system substrate-binding protein n=1 Tax=Salirhabdus euzebyi TaxID=394506 RepID=A0A841PWY6_9BACI|nr:Fur-regulated basic protein FbpA [Salirhabdus euzebyi]MBB6452464.1 TRAP-type uncharacterized transport system substrate-binding protein [Salirhabdus euzebyi]